MVSVTCGFVELINDISHAVSVCIVQGHDLHSVFTLLKQVNNLSVYSLRVLTRLQVFPLKTWQKFEQISVLRKSTHTQG